MTVSNNKERRYLPQDFRLTDFNSIRSYLKELRDRPISSDADYDGWLRDLSEFEAVVAEDYRWRYVRSTLDTTDEEAQKQLEQYYQEIHPGLEEFNNQLNKRIVSLPFRKAKDIPPYSIMFRAIDNSIDLFRQENIDVRKEINVLREGYGKISGRWSIKIEEKEFTLQQAAAYFKSTDRSLRKTVFEKIAARRAEDANELDDLLTKLIVLRQQEADNADFKNFRDYKFKSLGRFDYQVEDCLRFHESIQKTVIPLANRIIGNRRDKLSLERLRPYDLEVDLESFGSKKPFSDQQDFIDKTVGALNNIDPLFGECLLTMDSMNRLDLESRVGKAPGGYNMGMPETGVPFIFMNAASNERDIRTLFHEVGHAVHALLAHDLPLNGLKDVPSEIAELASMSLELISMDEWGAFYEDEELNIRKKNQLGNIITLLPAIALGDRFQHWLYTNDHSVKERRTEWIKLQQHFSSNLIDWTGYEQFREIGYHKILHIFEVPFYYIEYAMAQLGAIAVYRNYKKNPAEALAKYKNALSLGYTCSIPEIYEAAGIKFDFSEAYVKELMDFLWSEYLQL